MSELGRETNEMACPFAELLDRHVLGDSSQEDDVLLEKHVEQGCPSCAPRFHEWNQPPAAEDEEQLARLIDGAMAPIEDQIEARRLDMLRKISERISKEEKHRFERRKRRTSLNTILFGTILASAPLLGIGYFLTLLLATRVVHEQREQAFVEIGAILDALRRYSREHGFTPLESVPLGKSLVDERRLDLRPYYVARPRIVDPKDGRVVDQGGMDAEGHLLDQWGRRYIYQRVTGGARIRSVGPNGRDEQGTGDDITGDLPFDPPPKREPPRKEVGAPPATFDPTYDTGLKLAYAAFQAISAAQAQKSDDPDAVAALQAIGLMDDEGHVILDRYMLWNDTVLRYRDAHKDEWEKFLSENSENWHNYVAPEHREQKPK